MCPCLRPITILLLLIGLSGCAGHWFRASSDAHPVTVEEKLSSMKRRIDVIRDTVAISRTTIIGRSSSVAASDIYNEGGDLTVGSSTTRDGRRCVQVYRDLCIIHNYYRRGRDPCVPGYLDEGLRCLLPESSTPIAVLRGATFIDKSEMGPDVTINGNTQINASARNVVTTASGNGLTAITDVGVIPGSTITGNTRINATASNVVTLASGVDATASTQVGSISGASINGNTTINASVDNAISTAGGNGACAQTRVGVIGRSKCYDDITQAQAAIRNAEQPAAAYGVDDAPFIPWPPPPPASMGDVTRYFRMQGRYGDVAAQIRSRLAQQGYESVRFFRADDRGFAVTTELERLGPDGNPAKERWAVGKTGIVGSFFGYLRALVGGEDGQFRLFTFVVLDGDVQPAGGPVTESMVDKWRDDGRMELSAVRAGIPVTPATRVWLLVYEFNSARSKRQSYVATHQQRPFSFHARALGLR